MTEDERLLYDTALRDIDELRAALDRVLDWYGPPYYPETRICRVCGALPHSQDCPYPAIVRLAGGEDG